MPIRPPALDDRGFEDLVADMLRRIPAHTPEWTDIRQGDPGRTLIELFAWLGDTILYRANLIPERQRLAFLRLLGSSLRPAGVARGLVQVAIDDPAVTDAVQLPFRSPITKPINFELESELTVLPVDGRAYIKRRPSNSETNQLSSLIADLKTLYSIGGTPNAYVTTPVFPSGNAELAGRDFVAESIDKCLWIALLAPTPEKDVVKAVAKTLAGPEGKRAALSMGLAPYIDTPGTLEAISARAPVPHVWEICTGSGAGDEYLPLELLSDGTSGLTRTGVQRLLLPGSDDFGVPGNDMLANLQAGVGDRPPRIDDDVTAARLVAWLRLRPLPAAQLSSLKLSWAGVNAVMIDQRKSLGRQQIGRGTGLSGQDYDLGVTQVEAATLVIEVEEEEGMRVWSQVPDIAFAGPGARAFSLDAEAGTIRFGDGVRGGVPAVGRAIHVAFVRTGGGVAGNLPVGSLKAIVGPDPQRRLKLVQPLPLIGGSEAERLDEAERRIPSALSNGDRAVTKSDYQSIALATPGVQIGRVEVLERFKPQQRRFDIPGVVSVMVLPARAGTAKPAPRADRALLETVHGWLDVRRPLTTELYVIAPDYVPVGVSAAVEVVDPAQRDAVLEAVADVVRLHLWPLAPGGPDGSGWPLGRALDDRLIETAIARIPGVRTVAPIRLFARAANGRFQPVAEDATGRGHIALQPWQLPELAMLSVTEGEAASNSLPPASDTDAGAGGVGIPVVPELC